MQKRHFDDNVYLLPLSKFPGYMSRFLLNAIPEDDFKYFSKAWAFFSDINEQYQIIFQGLNLLVCLFAPEL